MGTGINKIISLLKENGNVAPVFKFNSFYTVTFKRNGGVNGGVKSNENLLLEVIIKNPGKRTNELAKILKTPERTVEKWINKLKDKNKIVFEGSSKTGGYYIMNHYKPTKKNKGSCK